MSNELGNAGIPWTEIATVAILGAQLAVLPAAALFAARADRLPDLRLAA